MWQFDQVISSSSSKTSILKIVRFCNTETDEDCQTLFEEFPGTTQATFDAFVQSQLHLLNNTLPSELKGLV